MLGDKNQITKHYLLQGQGLQDLYLLETLRKVSVRLECDKTYDSNQTSNLIIMIVNGLFIHTCSDLLASNSLTIPNQGCKNIKRSLIANVYVLKVIIGNNALLCMVFEIIKWLNMLRNGQ